MNVAKQLQINIYVASAGSPLDLYNKDFLKEVIYPVFYANQQATIGGTRTPHDTRTPHARTRRTRRTNSTHVG
jgi:hypothetical protein